MNPNILNVTDISKLEKLFFSDGLIKPVAYSDLLEFTQNQISLFCHKHGIYQIPTKELIKFIKSHIGEDSAIEIGSGNGCIGRALGIRMTDNKMQDIPEIKAHYQMMGQPTVNYGSDVEKIDGISAILKYKPKVVVACWVTQKWKPGMEEGNALGVDEELIFKNGVEKYIFIGNEKTHSRKEILEKYPHRKFKHKTIVSRSLDSEKNIAYIFTKK